MHTLSGLVSGESGALVVTEPRKNMMRSTVMRANAQTCKRHSLVSRPEPKDARKRLHSPRPQDARPQPRKKRSRKSCHDHSSGKRKKAKGNPAGLIKAHKYSGGGECGRCLLMGWMAYSTRNTYEGGRKKRKRTAERDKIHEPQVGSLKRGRGEMRGR